MKSITSLLNESRTSEIESLTKKYESFKKEYERYSKGKPSPGSTPEGTAANRMAWEAEMSFAKRQMEAITKRLTELKGPRGSHEEMNESDAKRSEKWKEGKKAYYDKVSYDSETNEEWKEGYRYAQRVDRDTEESDRGHIDQQKRKVNEPEEAVNEADEINESRGDGKKYDDAASTINRLGQQVASTLGDLSYYYEKAPNRDSVKSEKIDEYKRKSNERIKALQEALAKATELLK